MSAVECRSDRLEAGARPHVGAMRIACAHRGGPQRPGQVMDLGVSERRLRLVVVDEAVAKSPRVAAGKRLGHNGFGELWVLQRSAVHGAAARFVGEQERRAELRCHRPCLDHTADVIGGHQATGGDDGDADPSYGGGEQFGQWLRVGLCDGVERAAVPARRRALHRDRVDTAVHRGIRLVDRGHGADRGDARVAQPRALLDARQSERERCHLGPQVEQTRRSWPPRHRRCRRARPSSAPYRCASGASAAAYFSIASGVAALGCGANRLTPSGPVVSFRAAAIRSARASALR